MKTRIGIFLTVLLLMAPVISAANSMEPPGIILLIEGNHKDLEAWVEIDNQRIGGREIDYFFETQYWFSAYYGYEAGTSATIHVASESDSMSFEISDLEAYRNTYTIDLGKKVLREGKSTLRSIGLVGSRVLMTLGIEALVFFIFGFRNNRSWIAFILINLITQGALNLYINSASVATSYPIFLLVFGEFWVFLAEMIAVPILVKEKSTFRKIGYAFIANLFSLVFGGYLLSYLPL